MCQIGEVVQPQPLVSSDEEQRQPEEQGVQGEVDFGGFMSSSLPAFYPGFSYAQPLATTTTATATANPSSGHVRYMSLDRTISRDGNAASERLESHLWPLPLKVPEGTLVCHSFNV